MNFREAHKIWIAQCEAAETVRARFGLKAAFNYIVGEKLIILSKRRPIIVPLRKSCRDLFSEVRRMFTPEEIGAQLTRIERERNEKDEEVLNEDDPLRESPVKIAERVRQFTRIKALLTASTVGTS